MELWEVLRSIIYQEGEASSDFINLDDSLEKNRNPYNQEHTERIHWVKETELNSVKEGQTAEILYYVGCTSSYQEKSIANCTVTILNKMNEDWSIFGKDEWCCGDPHLAIGNTEKAKEFAKHNIEVASSLGAKTIVASCAHCYRMWKYKYPELLKENHNFRILHATEYLKNCIESEKLKLDKTLTDKITYHDPCYLSRVGDIVKEPRIILNHLTIDYVEMEEITLDTFCCGGGGMLEAVNKDLWSKIGDERLTQADMKAKILVSACPFCKRSLTQAAARKDRQIDILDITELIAEQLKE